MRVIVIWLAATIGVVLGQRTLNPAINPGKGLKTYPGCQLVESKWSDGDSFPVLFPDGTTQTVRLYGVDCFETTDRHETDQRRLRSQRAYFGMARAGGDEQASIALAKGLGLAARKRVGELLAEPFTVQTAWADGRGNPRFKRYYAFISDAKGRDLGGVLVREGLARAFGVARAREAGVSREEYKERLADEELSAASRRVGAWQLTNWQLLPEERRVAREQELEDQTKREKKPLEERSIDPNRASRDELMRLPGIGEVIAIRILEVRETEEFGTAADLRLVPGIGAKTVEKLAPYLMFPDGRQPGKQQ